MKRFTFEILEVETVDQLRKALNTAGQRGFELKKITREGIEWIAVLQKEEVEQTSGRIGFETATRSETVSPKTENL